MKVLTRAHTDLAQFQKTYFNLTYTGNPNSILSLFRQILLLILTVFNYIATIGTLLFVPIILFSYVKPVYLFVIYSLVIIISFIHNRVVNKRKSMIFAISTLGSYFMLFTGSFITFFPKLIGDINLRELNILSVFANASIIAILPIILIYLAVIAFFHFQSIDTKRGLEFFEIFSILCVFAFILAIFPLTKLTLQIIINQNLGKYFLENSYLVQVLINWFLSWENRKTQLQTR